MGTGAAAYRSPPADVRAGHWHRAKCGPLTRYPDFLGTGHTQPVLYGTTVI